MWIGLVEEFYPQGGPQHSRSSVRSRSEAIFLHPEAASAKVSGGSLRIGCDDPAERSHRGQAQRGRAPTPRPRPKETNGNRNDGFHHSPGGAHASRAFERRRDRGLHPLTCAAASARAGAACAGPSAGVSALALRRSGAPQPTHQPPRPSAVANVTAHRRQRSVVWRCSPTLVAQPSRRTRFPQFRR